MELRDSFGLEVVTRKRKDCEVYYVRGEKSVQSVK